jgi:hypothetical protein
MFWRSKTILLLSFLSLTINNVFSQTQFAVIGDYGDDNNNELAVANMVKSWNVDFIITLGDNTYNDDLDNDVGKYYQEFIYPYYGVHGDGSPTGTNRFYPSLGNHDDSPLQDYLDYFTLPGNELYFDFVEDNIHFFVINTESNLSSQENWLESQTLNCSTNHLHWKIVYYHKPAYSSGSHGNHSDVQWDYIGMGVHAVFAGHDHNYERLIVGGLVYFVNGSGGKSLRNVGNPISYSEFIYDDQHGAQLVTIVGTEMLIEFYNKGGTLIDPWTVIDDAFPLSVELAFFTAKPDGKSVALRWRTETEVNNYGFDIERFKDNSKWLTIGFVEGHGNSNSPKQYNFIDTDIDQSGTYYYRLKQIDNDGTYEYSDVVSVEVGVPDIFYLSQNYPNPFNPETSIEFTLPGKRFVSLRVFNTLGELVGKLVNEEREAGSYFVTFNASNLPSGVYIYRLQTSSFAANKKMTLLR